MKKLVPWLLVLLVVAAAAFFFVKMRRSAPERPHATQLAPAETIFFAHTPNLFETAKRFQNTGLYAIWREPEVQEFLEKPRKTAPTMQQWEMQFARLSRVAPREAFVAVTAMDGPQPRFVAGFSFAGKRREVEALLAEPRAEFKKRWPPGSSASAHLAERFVRNWYFVASDAALLRATLDRFENGGAGALAGNDIFQKATAPLGTGLDVMLYGRPAAWNERLARLAPANSEAGAIQAVSAGTRIEGSLMRDMIFILSPRETAQRPLSRITLAMGGPQTLLYLAMGIASSPQLPESLGALAAALPGVAGMEQSLSERELEWSDFDAAFGPEWGTTVEWPDDATVPALLMAVEVRDAAKAREFVDALTSTVPGAPAWSRRDEADVSYYIAPVAGLPLANPTIAISPRFVLLGFGADAVAGAVQRMNPAAAGNAASSPFHAAAEQWVAPASGFGYLDAPALFERAYRALRPALTMSLAFSGDLGDYIDTGRLPSSETISKHLTPSVFSQSATQDGVLMESAGTLTFSQLIFGTMVGATAAFRTGAPSATVSVIDGPPHDATDAKRDVAADVPAPPGKPESAVPAR